MRKRDGGTGRELTLPVALLPLTRLPCTSEVDAPAVLNARAALADGAGSGGTGGGAIVARTRAFVGACVALWPKPKLP